MKKIILLIMVIFIICANFGILSVISNNKFPTQKSNYMTNDIIDKMEENIDNKNDENIIDDWKLTLVNYENILPENFEVELANIDESRQFDKRAINELFAMMEDAKSQGASDMWVQSAYRSISYQQGLFDKKVDFYLSQGKTREEAEELTLQKINKPGTSEHNLGLAVDFNYVNYNFENTKAFKWLLKNAENYGFIMRYRKDKEDITKVDYEPWHWRYVGVENAKKINELDMCLEEYKNIAN